MLHHRRWTMYASALVNSFITLINILLVNSFRTNARLKNISHHFLILKIIVAYFIIIFENSCIGFIPYKAIQSLRGMEFYKKEKKKQESVQETCLKTAQKYKLSINSSNDLVVRVLE